MQLIPLHFHSHANWWQNVHICWKFILRFHINFISLYGTIECHDMQPHCNVRPWILKKNIAAIRWSNPNGRTRFWIDIENRSIWYNMCSSWFPKFVRHLICKSKYYIYNFLGTFNIRFLQQYRNKFCIHFYSVCALCALCTLCVSQ